ncbi:MAG TPA: hypothetical protein VGX26_07090 [Solirubrobacteraceae bacterium]|nr:hypothetical protein [Solirubrobacteraceae bacterium]
MTEPTPITPDDFVDLLDDTAWQIAARGAPFILVHHYRWMYGYLSRIVRAGKPIRVVLKPFPGVPGLTHVRVPITMGIDGWSAPWLPFIVLLVAAAKLFSGLREFAGNTVSVVGHSLRRIAEGNIENAAPLVAALIVVFLTGDAWKIVGRTASWRLAVLTTIFLGAGTLLVMNLRKFPDDLSEFTEDTQTPSYADTLGGHLARLDGLPHGESPGTRFGGWANVVILYVLAIVSNLIVLGLLVAAAFVLVGVLLIDANTTKELTGQTPHVIWHLPVGGLVLTRELLSLALGLGALSALSFAAAGLPNAAARKEFRREVTRGLVGTLVAIAIYDTAVMNDVALTDVPRS